VGGKPLVLDAYDHALSFYADDAELVATIAAFFADGFAAGETITLVATPEHRSALEHALLRLGVPHRQLRDPARYRPFDAAEVLHELMPHGELVEEQFHARVTTMLGPGRTRIFGEMVALLWADGDVASAIREIKAGKVEFRVDKTGIVHVPVGKLSFPDQNLIDNANAIVHAVVRAKPPAAKGKYMKSITVASTMGPGVKVDPAVGEAEPAQA